MQAPRHSVWWKIHTGKAFFSAIRPACQAGTRYQSLCLDSEYDKIKVDTVATIAASDSVGLMCDGCSNIRNETIINFVVSQPKSIFLKRPAKPYGRIYCNM